LVGRTITIIKGRGQHFKKIKKESNWMAAMRTHSSRNAANGERKTAQQVGLTRNTISN